MAGQRWSREEVLAAFNLYLTTPFGRLHARNPEIITLAAALGRTPGSVAMKCCHLASLDPALQKRGIKGLRGISAVDREVFNEFQTDPESIAFDSEVAASQLVDRELKMVPTIEWQNIDGKDRMAVVKTRVNQYLFRAMILSGYRESCAVCELRCPELLVAAHIVGWAIDAGCRMNPRNGLCLCAIHDRAFDKDLLDVEDDYTIKVTKKFRVPRSDKAASVMLYSFDGKKLMLPERWLPDPDLLRRRRELMTNATLTF